MSAYSVIDTNDENLKKALCISYSANALEKDMNPFLLSLERKELVT